MEKLSELTIMDVKELVKGRTVSVSSRDSSPMGIHMKNAIMAINLDGGTDGQIILLEPKTRHKIVLDSDTLIESIHGNENTIEIRFNNSMGILDVEIMGETPYLIRPVDEEFDYKEPVHEDFVPREEFINRTGIFVTPEYYEYLYDMEFKKANVSADEFVNNYVEKYSNCIEEVPLDGTFRYEVMDEDLGGMCFYEDIYPNIWEIINSLAMSYSMERQSKWELVEKYKSALEDNLKTLNGIKEELLNRK